jgi:exopolysaccharide production protein ExoQ
VTSSSSTRSYRPDTPRNALGINILDVLENCFAIIGLFFFTSGLDTLLLGQDMVIKALRYLILLISFIFLLLRWRSSLKALIKGALLWPLILLAIVSYTWSIFPIDTIDSIQGETFPTVCFSLYFASRFTIRQQLRLLAITLGIGTLLSIFYAVAIPSVGIEPSGDWKGIYVQKNNFSGMMIMALMVFFVLGSRNENPVERLFARFGLWISIAAILLSNSKTGLILFIVLLSFLYAFKHFRWRGVRTLLIADLLLMTVFFSSRYIFGNWEPLVEGLGKDPTMSGRTVIWYGSFMKIAERPWLGYGRESFWVKGSQDAWEVGALLVQGFVPAHAHNGYIDILIDLGIIGLILFLIGFIPTIVLAFKRAYKATRPEDLWPLALMMLVFLYNMTESVLMKRANFYWVIYLSTFIGMRYWPRLDTPKT